ncbi:MAG: hypothetical protein J6D18_05305 [Erysipelotrichaceae bacterium]|nr:hypothetical protein [Erysipelotrichaceae bacterium]
MNSYYQSLIQEVQHQMDNEQYQQAISMIEAELALPYVPADALEQLKQLKEDCSVHIEKKAILPELDTLIHGNQSMQELAVSQLMDMNLRNHLEEVEILLNSDDLYNEIKGELIEALMEQKVDIPVHMKRDGCEYTFIPSQIIPAQEDGVLQEAIDCFDQWFANDNPTFYRFCCRLLEQERLENRPFDFTEAEALPLAKSIVRLVSEAFGQSEMFEQFERQNGLQSVQCTPLLIERRGEIDENELDIK